MGELTPGICALTLKNERQTLYVARPAKYLSRHFVREEKTILVTDVLRLYKNQQEAEWVYQSHTDLHKPP